MMATIKMNRHEALLHLQQVVEPTARISADSRQIKVGDIFMAYAVGHGKALRDGRPYISKALELGELDLCGEFRGCDRKDGGKQHRAMSD